MSQSRTAWDLLRDDYARKVNLPTYIIEYLSIFPIIRYVSQGLSNTWISKRMGIPVSYVESTLIQFMDFTGWDENLSFSPIAVYIDVDGDYDYYVTRVMVDYNVSRSVANITFHNCYTYLFVKKALGNYGY